MIRWLRIPLAVAIIIAAVLLVILAAGGANSVIFERYFPILLIVDWALCRLAAAIRRPR